MVVQWLGLDTFTAEGFDSIPGWGTRIPQAVRCGQKKIKNKTLILILLLLVSLNYLQDGFNSFNLKRLKKTVNLYFIASHKNLE